MLPPTIDGRPCERRHDLYGRISTMGPYVVVRLDDLENLPFWVEVTIPTWRLLWMVLQNLIPFVDHHRIRIEPRFKFRTPLRSGTNACRLTTPIGDKP